MSFPFKFNPSLWFICRFCRQVFPDTEKLKDHKLEHHLGNCLGIKCIVFEERCVEEDWIPPEVSILPNNTNKSVFQNPFVSLIKLTSEEVDSNLNHNDDELKSDIQPTGGNSAVENSLEMEIEETTNTIILAENQELNNVEELSPSIEIEEGELQPELEPELKPFSISEMVLNSDSNHSSDLNEYWNDNYVSNDNQCVELKLYTLDTDASSSSITPFQEDISLSEQELPSTSEKILSNRSYSDVLNSNSNTDFTKNNNSEDCNPPTALIGEFNSPLSSTVIPISQESQEESKQFMCLTCFSSFRTSWYLRKHMKSHSNDRPFKCPQCSLTYKSKCGLDYHLVSHGLTTSNKCCFCGKFFLRKNDLDNHERTHTGDRPFRCQVGNCEAAFASSKRLNEHTHASHYEELGLPQFICHLCGKSFGVRQTLKCHYRKVHNLQG